MPDPPSLPPRAALPAVLLLLAAVLCVLLPARASAADYVALGDSYSSGLGAGHEQDRACRRSAVAFPAIVAAHLPGTTLRSVACAGATTADVVAAQLPALAAATDLVTMTVGGNDAGFAAVLKRCAAPGLLARCSRPVRSARATIQGRLPGRLDRLLADVRRRAPSARLVLVGYPRVFNGDDCGPFTFFSPGDQRLLNATADLLQTVLRAAARRAGAAFADPAPAFRGHAVCDEEEWLNGLSVPLRESFHPNATGHARGYAPAVLRALGR